MTLDGGVTVKVICGEVEGTQGPVHDIVTDPEYLDVTVPPQAEFTPSHQAGPHGLRLRHRGQRHILRSRTDPFTYEMRGRQLLRYRDENALLSAPRASCSSATATK